MRSHLSPQDDGISPELSRMYAWLVPPVEADIQAQAVLAIVPTGVLDYLPFPAQSGQYLIERKQCVTLLKSTDVARISRAGAATGRLKACGHPDGTLPEAALEVQGISRLFPGTRSVVGARATADVLEPGAGTAMVHLATHGVLDSRNPAASYLVLGGNSRLMLPDIYDLKLAGIRLVTLSACDTAIGEREPGRTLTTLADAFSVAGSNSVVASLWKVSDASTKELMLGFYQGLKDGQSLAQSLQGAQRALLQRPEFRHPFYWAPFVLLGDWR